MSAITADFGVALIRRRRYGQDPAGAARPRSANASGPWWELGAGLLPALLLVAIPLTFLPVYDAFILPRAALSITGAGLLLAAAAWRRSGAERALAGLALPLLATAAAAVLAAAFAAHPALALAGAYARYESGPMRLAYAGLFAGAALLVRTERQRQWAVDGFVLAATAIALEALHELVTGVPPRPDGNLGQANLCGALLATALPFAAVRLFSDWRWAPAPALLGAGLIACSSRSGWLGAAAGVAVLVPLVRAPGTPRRRALAALAALAVPLVGAGLLLATPLAHLNGDSGQARLHVWADALPMIAARPVTGWGEDNVGPVFGGWVRGDWEPGATFDRLHDLPLDLLAAQGVLGLAACAWLWAAWAARLLRLMSAGDHPVAGQVGRSRCVVAPFLAGWLAYLVAGLFNFDWAPATAPLWLLGGVAVAEVAATAAAVPRRAGGRGQTAAAAALTAGLLGAVAALAVLPLLADARYYAGDAAAAVGLDPLQARYHQALGERRLSAGDYAGAAAELDAALALGDADVTAAVELGDARLRLGDRIGAIAAYRRAQRLDPFDGRAGTRLRSLT